MYTNQAKVEAYLKRVLTASELVNLDDTIEYLSEMIDNYCNRQWSPLAIDEGYEDEDDPTARLFDGNNGKELWIDDCQDISKIEILDSSGNVMTTYITTTDWITYPLNKDIIESVVLRGHKFPQGRANIQVTAIFGSGTVPKMIVMVCTALVADFLADSGDVSEDFKKESIEGYSYELFERGNTNEEQQKLFDTLSKYKKETL
jgi:hypothetical protein